MGNRSFCRWRGPRGRDVLFRSRHRLQEKGRQTHGADFNHHREQAGIEVYDFWRRFDRLPSFMAHVEDVRITGDRTSHWKASAPFAENVEWDTETTEDIPGQSIAWRSLDGADVQNSGVARFVPAPGARGTEVHVTLTFDVPGGSLGRAIARYFGEDPSQQLDDDLRRFKQVLETGEVVRSDGAPWRKRAPQGIPAATRPAVDR